MEQFEWYMGTQLVSSNSEILTPVSPDEIVKKIKTDDSLRSRIEDLKRAKAIDTKAYRKLKTNLPYFVTSKFDGNIRKTDRFEYTQYWIIDLDECLLTPSGGQKLKEKIKQDPMTMMMFVSPGGEGLKVVFQLDTPCTSAQEHSLAYKSFATGYAEYLELEGIVDLKTSDVARACFLSYDPDVYYYPFPQCLEWRKYLPTNSVETAVTEVKATPVVDNTVISNIQQIINPQRVAKRNDRQVFQPAQLKEIEVDLLNIVSQQGIKVENIVPLNYGIKLIVSKNYQRGEVNIFYGKKGFLVVTSPKSGTSPELNQILYETVTNLLMS